MAYEMERWDLTHLFKDGSKEHLDDHVRAIEAENTRFTALRTRLDAMTTDEFVEAIRLKESINYKEAQIIMYLNLRIWVDNDAEAKALKSHYVTRLTELENERIFFGLWFKDLDDERAQAFIEAAPDYAYYLVQIRAGKPYMLSEAEEKIVGTMSQFSSNALNQVRGTLTSNFTFDFDEDHKGITQEEVRQFRHSKNKGERHRAYEVEMEKFMEFRDVLNDIYRTAVLEWNVLGVDTRGYSSPMRIQTFSEDIDESTIQTLLDVCRQNVHLVQRHMRLKARALGEDKLHRHDIYAPVGEDDTTYTYDEAVQMTLRIYESFDPEFGAFARQIFDEHMVDSIPRKGKRSGAFSYSYMPDVLPYIMLNFTGTFSDVSTMTHEIGHGVHHCFAAKSNNLTNIDPVMPLAETASTFGETALIEHILAEADDDQKFVIYDQMLEDFYATVFRQAYFVLFEQAAHQAYREAKSMDDIAGIYYGLLKEQFGDDVELPEHFRWEWVTIPHIVKTPFYCYSYTFGHMFSLSLYDRFKQEGAAFVPTVKKVLEAGGSMKPSDIVAAAGFNMDTKDFWQGGMRFYERMLDQYERLLDARPVRKATQCEKPSTS